MQFDFLWLANILPHSDQLLASSCRPSVCNAVHCGSQDQCTLYIHLSVYTQQVRMYITPAHLINKMAQWPRKGG